MQTARAATPQTDSGQYLAFRICDDEYAVGVLRVREIIEYDTVTPVPATPPWIQGVINLRGSVVPVVDLAVKFGLCKRAVTRRTCIVIVEADLEGRQTAMGVVADAVNQVIDLRPEEIEPPPAFGTRVRVDFLVGMGKVSRKFVLLLDIDRVLSASELLAASSVGVEAHAPEAGAMASA